MKLTYKGKCDNCGMDIKVNVLQEKECADDEVNFFTVNTFDVQCWGCGRTLHLKEECIV